MLQMSDLDTVKVVFYDVIGCCIKVKQKQLFVDVLQNRLEKISLFNEVRLQFY